MTKGLLLEIKDITIYYPGSFVLPGTSFSISRGENILVTGKNGSGKTSLMKALTGEVSICKGNISRYHKLPLSKNISYISFENLRKILRKQEILEEAEYYSGKEIKPDAFNVFDENRSFSKIFDLNSFKGKKIDNLSSGELRKFQILKALENDPELLILDEPFDGLDSNSVDLLKKFVLDLCCSDIAVILVTHRVDEISGCNFKYLAVNDNKVFEIDNPDILKISDGKTPDLTEFEKFKPDFKKELIAELSNCSVHYGEKKVLENINLQISTGEKWVVKGENGCGKSTLLSLITGDNLQVYSNEVRVFGKKRGFGTTLWEFKKNTGYVSPSLHLKYDKKIEAYKVLISGYFDSVGLYRKPDKIHIDTAKYIFKKFNIDNLFYKSFLSLSYGQQRLVLILRSLIKDPDLIIMDEPCHGLDSFHRKIVLDIVRTICKMPHKSLIYVTHSDLELDFNYDYIFEFIRKKDNLGYYTKTIRV
ncbi:MAG: ATP-binding cassette domain-containing protein [Desulfobacteraceae bacterium]|nr:ATP-binding cassette domain-containing protein [Desulfobacteraceae bacterium]MCB9495127.1 ATP-binding cassette domain-containing protein [Desulfobacteraceae bacterium]